MQAPGDGEAEIEGALNQSTQPPDQPSGGRTDDCATGNVAGIMRPYCHPSNRE